ncbi:unnamed protein product [Lymnaea stagnalis]|uniref:Uncharacterized protein n=1 Tax=Lymnaea stagnalis TaxID=6523 RepID=A0AAV2IBE9_LYMST
MSCRTLCQCQHSWPLDTQGSKRDPVNSEKAWLDFAVRLLSREVVGKGRGQETVWSERCKPVWWDEQVGLPWKNPTSNPKDTKDILQKKYSVLEKYLSADGRFPRELEEEAKLWNEGKIKELFLLTTLTSLLGKVTGLHVAVVDACQQVDIMKAGVNNYLLRDIKQCLTATLKETENFKVSNAQPNMLPGKENNVKPSKRRRVEPATNKPSETTTLTLKKVLISPKYKKVEDVAPNPTSSLQKESINHTPDPKKQEEILAVAQKILGKRRNQSVNARVRGKFVENILPKPHESVAIINLPPVYSLTTLPPVKGNACISMEPNSLLKVISPISLVQITDPENTGHFLNTRSTHSLTPVNFSSLNLQDVSQTSKHNLLNDGRNSGISIHLYSSSESSIATAIQDSNPSPFVCALNSPNTSSLGSSPTSFSSIARSEDITSLGGCSRSNIDPIENVFLSYPVLTISGSETPMDRVATFSDASLAVLNNSCSTDSGFSDSDFSDASQCGQGHMFENVIDRLGLDEMSPYLWQEDGSLHLDRFLDDLD